MANTYDDPDINEGMAITETGGSKANCRISRGEYSKRNFDLNDEVHQRVANVFTGDLLFQRVGVAPSRAAAENEDDGHIEVFTSFNGILHQNPRSFRCVGRACNQAENQMRNGPLGQQFAAWTDGAGTIRCNSAEPISKGAEVAWCMPNDPNLPVDITGSGRQLAQLYEWRPDQTKLTARKIHNIMARIHANDTLTPEEKQLYSAHTKLYELLAGICYTGTIAFLESDTDGGSFGKMSSAEKLRIAAMYGLTASPQTTDRKASEGLELRKKKLRDRLRDSLFQMSTDPNNLKMSNTDESKRVFPLARANGINTQERQVAAKTADQVQSLLTLVLCQYHEDRSNIIGFTNNGGFPGRKMDIVFRRL